METVITISQVHRNKVTFKKLKYWFGEDLAILLGGKLEIELPEFDTKDFSQVVKSKVDELELKERVEVICDEMNLRLTNNYKTNADIILRILGPENKEETGMFSNFYWLMPIAKFVEKYGLGDFETSMILLKEITKRNTSEYAIRPFIKMNPDDTFTTLKKWSVEENFHVRRLSCEGARPRLPWATKMDFLIQDPTPLKPILDNLRDDKSKYVQKSVANCLNDILKDNDEFGREIIKSWIKGAGKDRKWIIKHALRTLIKNDDGWAVQLVSRL